VHDVEQVEMVPLLQPNVGTAAVLKCGR
jgi:hypothetical protein